MKTKIQLNKTSLILALVILLQIVSSYKVVEAVSTNNNTITIHIQKSKGEGEKEAPLAGRKLKLWKIEESGYTGDKQKLLTEVLKISETELDKKYKEKLISSESTQNGEEGIITININDGIYLVKEILTEESIVELKPFLITAPNEGKTVFDVYPKKETPPDNPPEKSVILKKVDEDENVLKGVGFKLYSKVGANIEPVPLTNGKYDPNGKKDEVLYTDEKGQITITNLPEGEYFFKEVAPLNGYYITQEDNYFTIKKGEGTLIKVINKKTPPPPPNTPPKGEYNFIKIANDKNQTRLEGATFKITKKTDQGYETIYKGTTPYLVTSDEKGEFKITNLEYGNYTLWETQAPKGYKVGRTGIEFTINETSGTNKVIFIENVPEKTPPPKEEDKPEPPKPIEPPKETPPGNPEIDIPKTGDILLIVMTISGLILIGIGTKLIKEKETI